MRQGKPCGWSAGANTPEGLPACSSDSDCSSLGDFVCACQGHVQTDNSGAAPACTTLGQCDPTNGRCVLRGCRDQVATFHSQLCSGSPQLQACLVDLDACSLSGEECKFLSCIDDREGAATDNRIFVLK
jgi:hypothetical protein